MDTAARPSASATFTAAATMRSRLSPGLGPLCGRPRTPQAAATLAGGSCSPAARSSARVALRRVGSLMVSLRYGLSRPLRFGSQLTAILGVRIPYAVAEARDRGEHPMPHELAVEAAGLRKSYGSVLALAGVDLRVPAGSRCAVLGPNGAGKTTTVRILATLTRPDAGRARVAGCDIVRDRHRLRRQISLTGQFTGLDAQQTGAENLHMVARLSGLARGPARRRTAELLEQFGLAKAARRRVGTYSGGMRRRLDLAATLVAEPSVIFLDEPTTGLDLPSRLALWQVITELGGSGVTTVLTTQYLEEADRLADQIVVIDAGRVVAEGTPAELKRQVAGQRLELILTSRSAFDDVARAAAWVGVLEADPGRLLISLATDGSAAHVRQLLDALDPRRVAVESFSVRGATLDDVFLALTGHLPQAGEAGPHAQHDSSDQNEVIDV